MAAVSKAVQYFSDRIRGMDCRHNPHAAAAASAFENVDRKNAFHQFSPPRSVFPEQPYAGLFLECPTHRFGTLLNERPEPTLGISLP